MNMEWQYTIFLILAPIAATITITLFILARRHQTAPGAFWFSWLMLVTTGWLLFNTLELATSPEEWTHFWAKVTYIFIASAPVAWFAFALQYTDRQTWLQRPRFLLLCIIPLVTIMLVWTNDAHGLVWQSYQFHHINNVTAFSVSYGFWFWVNAAYAYMLIILGSALIIREYFYSSHLYRRQSTWLLIGAIIPLITNIIYILRLIPGLKKDYSPISFALAGTAIAIGILHYRLFDLKPIAHSTLIDSMSDALIVIDDQNRIIDLNPAFQNIIGIPINKVIGQPVNQIFRPRRDLIERFRDETDVQAEISLDLNGDLHHYDLRISPLCYRGQMIGRLILLRNITERKYAEEALRKLSRAVEQSPDSIVITDTEGNIEYVNPKFTKLTGYTLEEVIGQNPRILKSGHTPPEEYKRLWDIITSGREWQGEFYNKKKNGDLYWEFASISPIVNVEGAITHYLAIKEDITEGKRVEEALRKNEMRYRALFERTTDAVFILSLDLRHLAVNKQAADLLGYEIDEMIGMHASKVVAPEEWGNTQEKADFLWTGETPPIYERTFVRKDGSRVQTEINVAMVYDPEGNPLHIQSVVRDITERKRTEERLQELAITDSLTGLYNRRHFFALAEKELERAKRFNHDLSIIMFDIDHFKRVNDQYGHKVGDQTLQSLAKHCCEIQRDIDVLARWGGEEFVILLIETDLASAQQAAERLREAIEAATINPQAGTGSLTISAGVTCLTDEENLTIETMLDRADIALYQSKEMGRNRVTIG